MAEAGDTQWKDATNQLSRQLSSVSSMVAAKSANTMDAIRSHVAVLITVLLMEEVFVANSRGATVWSSASSNYVVLTEGALTDLDQEVISLIRRTISTSLGPLSLFCCTVLVFIRCNTCMVIFT
jgi:benzoyl-CoA reductase/2-hydroxyglutaryl-CoA dehydratase subunit BcrC/BadD/HgdB